MVTMFNDSDYVSAAPHSAALNVVLAEKVRVLDVSTHLQVIEYYSACFPISHESRSISRND